MHYGSGSTFSDVAPCAEFVVEGGVRMSYKKELKGS
jgi:hypothetical protein